MNMNERCYAPCNLKPNELIESEGLIPFELRDTKNKAMPAPPVNGGLYGGPQVYHPWMPIPVTPTSTNLTSQNLKSANPPPGATLQYIGNNRAGNNYVAKPGVYQYNNGTELNCGPFNIQGL
jgi:hypothetical protein